MTPEPETNGSPTPGLGPGTESDAVRALQSHLKGLGAYDGPEDGVFGPQTENAVRSVQRSHGLPPTGVADSQTEQLITAAAAADGGAERGTPAAVDAQSGRLVVNETNKRVVVHAKSGEVLVLSPLERRLIGNDDLELFREELRELERQCVVALPPPEISTRDAAIVGGGVWVVVGYVVAGFVVDSLFFWIGGAIALLIGAHGRLLRLAQRRPGGGPLERADLGALAWFCSSASSFRARRSTSPGDVDKLVREAYFDHTRSTDAIDLTLLGRGLQLLFMAAASLLPALLYFLFDRQQLRTLREQFERHMFRLDPRWTRSPTSARSTGRSSARATAPTTGRGQGRLLPGRRSPVLIATVVITFGWLVTLLNQDVHQISDRGGHPRALPAGALGAHLRLPGRVLLRPPADPARLRPRRPAAQDVHADHDPDPAGHDPRDGAPGASRRRRRARTSSCSRSPPASSRRPRSWGSRST